MRRPRALAVEGRRSSGRLRFPQHGIAAALVGLLDDLWVEVAPQRAELLGVLPAARVTATFTQLRGRIDKRGAEQAGGQ